MPIKLTYRELQDKLDAVLAELQDEEVDIDTVLAKYQEGLKLVEQLQTRLKTAENSVKNLKKSHE